MDWKFVLVLIFSLLVAVFTMQNAEAVNVQFLTFEFTQVSQALVILTSAVAGAVIAVLFGAIRWVKDKSKIAGSKKSIAGLETQVKQLRIMLDAEIAKNAPPTIEENVAAPILETEATTEPQASEADAPDTDAPDTDAPDTDAPEAEAIGEQEKVEEIAPKRKWYQL